MKQLLYWWQGFSSAYANNAAHFVIRLRRNLLLFPCWSWTSIHTRNSIFSFSTTNHHKESSIIQLQSMPTCTGKRIWSDILYSLVSNNRYLTLHAVFRECTARTSIVIFLRQMSSLWKPSATEQILGCRSSR